MPLGPLSLVGATAHAISGDRLFRGIPRSIRSYARVARVLRHLGLFARVLNVHFFEAAELHAGPGATRSRAKPTGCDGWAGYALCVRRLLVNSLEPVEYGQIRPQPV